MKQGNYKGEEFYIFSSRNGKTHFSNENLDWYAQNTLCSPTNLIKGHNSSEKYDDKSVDCKKCMVLGGFLKKLKTIGTESSPGIIGYSLTIYKVIKPFAEGSNQFEIGEEIQGDMYDRKRK